MSRHAELHGHHEDVIGLAVTAVMGLDILKNAALEKPTYLSAVYRITGEAIQLPAEDALRLATLNAPHHLSEHGAAGLLGRLLLDELADNGKPLPLCNIVED